MTPQRVTEDGFASETVGGAEVRRKVTAGQIVPDNWDVEGGTEDVDDNAVVGEGYEPVTGPEDAKTSQEAPLSQLFDKDKGGQVESQAGASSPDQSSTQTTSEQTSKSSSKK